MKRDRLVCRGEPTIREPKSRSGYDYWFMMCGLGVVLFMGPLAASLGCETRVADVIRSTGQDGAGGACPQEGCIAGYPEGGAGSAGACAREVCQSEEPQPPPRDSTLFGANFNPNTENYYDELLALFGGLQVRRSFDGAEGVGPFLDTYQPQDTYRGVPSAYSFKYLPADVLSGQHDFELTSFFEGIEDDHIVYWTYWHNADNDIYRDGLFAPADYRAAWAHVRSIADEVAARRPRLSIFATSIVMEYSMRPEVAPGRPLLGPDGMYPGDDMIDVFGIVAYNSSANDGDIADVATQYGKVIDFAQAHEKPWAVTEIASCPVAGNPEGRATYLTRAIRYWLERDYLPVFAAYFNSDGTTCNYRMDDDPAAVAVWQSAIREGLDAFR